ncbi:DUF6197 family protein [Bailinhaonella thermotolerans]|uniref:DUF6197 family protein n=1 Tax=Bailinhaonella thermotolerans TaxID=1070861 RepID=UPI000E721957|nr:hypothetical protein [Bailinhaonella thermotolerans]
MSGDLVLDSTAVLQRAADHLDRYGMVYFLYTSPLGATRLAEQSMCPVGAIRHSSGLHPDPDHPGADEDPQRLILAETAVRRLAACAPVPMRRDPVKAVLAWVDRRLPSRAEVVSYLRQAAADPSPPGPVPIVPV